MRYNSKPTKIVHSVILVIAGLTFLYPLVWLFFASFKESAQVMTEPLSLPNPWKFENYVAALNRFDFVSYFKNSVIYTGCTVFLTLLLVAMFTYATARMKFRSAGKLQALMQFGLSIPGGATLLGIYTILLKTGLINTYPGMVLTYTGMSMPLAAVILYGFFRSLPYSLEEAAAIDGAGLFRTFFSVILPMVVPAIGTVAVVTAMNVWNEFTVAFITINKNAMFSLPVGIATFTAARGSDWGGMSAALLLAVIPTILLYLLYSEQLENTMTAGAANK